MTRLLAGVAVLAAALGGLWAVTRNDSGMTASEQYRASPQLDDVRRANYIGAVERRSDIRDYLEGINRIPGVRV